MKDTNTSSSEEDSLSHVSSFGFSLRLFGFSIAPLFIALYGFRVMDLQDFALACALSGFAILGGISILLQDIYHELLRIRKESAISRVAP